ncbi:MAG: glycosyltransferase [Prevotellaceae bacterium]|jgi:glycosyltransferase involved in cell wall biosynthesis|nr:glycosyltransferase [Prevotellaceae bacterium]
MQEILISIIIPSYNSSQFIAETIESILLQTYANWELLITDDCSTDSTWKILNEYVLKDNRIRIFKLNTNSGAGAARNNSIKQAAGKYIAFCDSDDLWLPEKLEKQIKFMEDNKCCFSFSSYNCIDEKGEFIKNIKVKKQLTYSALLKNNYIPCLTTVYSASAVGEILMPEIRKRQDWAFWLKIIKITNYASGIEEPLALYRIRNNSLSKNKLGLLKYNFAIYRDIEQFSTLKSYLFTLRFLFFNFIYKKLGK